ncbi:MAG: matrixin family metalloprotease [Deltaproteobacteria bacterium]|nr:matrixin family metalloprotease [Deltaproteobacteria bacterium]
MMKRIVDLWGMSVKKNSCKLAVCILLVSSQSLAWIQETYDGTQFLHWKQNGNSVTNVTVSLNSQGYANLAGDSERTALISAVNTWNSLYPRLSSFYFTVALTGAASPSGFDNDHSILFDSSMGFTNTIAETSTVYYTKTGEIVGSDIRLNTNYRFVAGDESTNAWQVNIMDVITHELGHFIGLDHTPLSSSTMYFTAQDQQRFLSPDELRFIQSVYPPQTTLSTWSISGRVLLEATKRPVFGASVVAIRVDEGPYLGAVESGTLSSQRGDFTLSGLDPQAEYILAVLPSQNSSPYGWHYGQADDASIFKEKILIDKNESPLVFQKNSPHAPIIFLVGPTPIADTISHNNSQSEAFPLENFQRKILVGVIDPSEKKDVFQFEAQEGDIISARAVAFTLRSPIDLALRILHSPSQTHSSGHPFEKEPEPNLDPLLFQYEIGKIESGTQVLEVEAEKTLSAFDFPGSSSDGVAHSPFYILILHKKSGFKKNDIASPKILSKNAVCQTPSSPLLPMQCTLLEDEALELDFSQSGQCDIIPSSINRTLLYDIVKNKSSLVFQPQPEVAGFTKAFLSCSQNGHISYRQIEFSIEPVNDPPIIRNSSHQIVLNLLNNQEINLTNLGFFTDDSVDGGGVLLGGQVVQRISGVLPAQRLPDVQSSNSSVYAIINKGSDGYYLKVTGPVNESAELRFSVWDEAGNPAISKGETFVASSWNPLSASSVNMESSDPAVIVVNIVDSLDNDFGGQTKGFCAGVSGMTTPADKMNNIGNFLILLLPLLFLGGLYVDRKKTALCP